MSFKTWLISEELYPNKTATVFHRTSSLESIKETLRSGFKPGQGCMYGCGLYATFDLRSQFTSKMEQYGSYIIKFKVTGLENYLITPITVAKYVLKDSYKISDQFKKFGFSRLPGESFASKDYAERMAKGTPGFKYEEYDREQESNTFSSSLAHKIFTENKWIENRLTGIIYNGRQDGYCLVKYNPIMNGVTMLGYAEAEASDLLKYKDLINNKGWMTTTKSTKIKYIYGKSKGKEDDKDKYKLLRSPFEDKVDDILDPEKGVLSLRKLSFFLRREEFTEENLIYLLKRHAGKNIVKTAIETIAKYKPDLITRNIISVITHAAYDTFGLLKIIINLKGTLNEDLFGAMINASHFLKKNERKEFVKILSQKYSTTLVSRPNSSPQKDMSSSIEEIIMAYIGLRVEISDAIEIIDYLGKIGVFEELPFKSIINIIGNIGKSITEQNIFGGKPQSLVFLIKSIVENKQITDEQLLAIAGNAAKIEKENRLVSKFYTTRGKKTNYDEDENIEEYLVSIANAIKNSGKNQEFVDKMLNNRQYQTT